MPQCAPHLHNIIDQQFLQLVRVLQRDKHSAASASTQCSDCTPAAHAMKYILALHQDQAANKDYLVDKHSSPKAAT
jgi:hypothetical protein